MSDWIGGGMSVEVMSLRREVVAANERAVRLDHALAERERQVSALNAKVVDMHTQLEKLNRLKSAWCEKEINERKICAEMVLAYNRANEDLAFQMKRAETAEAINESVRKFWTSVCDVDFDKAQHFLRTGEGPDPFNVERDAAVARAQKAEAALDEMVRQRGEAGRILNAREVDKLRRDNEELASMLETEQKRPLYERDRAEKAEAEVAQLRDILKMDKPMFYVPHPEVVHPAYACEYSEEEIANRALDLAVTDLESLRNKIGAVSDFLLSPYDGVSDGPLEWRTLEAGRMLGKLLKGGD
jgi:hypothetical protein